MAHLAPGQGNGDEGWINPLNHEVVLRKILGFMFMEDLKICRLVNSLWNTISVPHLKKECHLVSFNNDRYWTCYENHGIEDMARFTQCFRSSLNFPFVKLDVGTSIVKEPEDENVVHDFFNVICSSVTELTIRDEYGKSLFPTKLPQNLTFPSLQKLTLHLIEPISSAENFEMNFELITKIMMNAPALEKIELFDHNGTDGSAVTYFLESVKKANRTSITSFYLAGQLEDEHLLFLSKMNLKLKTLYLDFWGSLIKSESLKGFLETQSANLVNLTIADYAMSSRFDVDFPKMKTLKSFLLKGSLLGRTCISFPKLSYEKQFPILKRLSFSNAMDEWDEFLKSGISAVETVEELKLPRDCVDDSSLKHAAYIFPKLKQLQVGAYAHLMNTIVDFMPDLEELILNTKYVDLVDDIITGLDIMECNAIRVSSSSKSLLKRLEQNYMNITTNKPLSCLKKLKILRLKCTRRSDPVELTDLSCQLVLLKMESLKCLDLWRRSPHPDMVSDSVLRKMKKQFLVLC